MLRYTDPTPRQALRYLEFWSFDEAEFLNAFSHYLREVFHADVLVRDDARRKTPAGLMQPAFQVFVGSVPIFDVVSNNRTSCFVGVSRGTRESVYSAEAILDAFLNHYMQPKQYLEVEF